MAALALDTVRATLGACDLGHRVEAVLALAQPCWWLSAERGAGRSRIGGEPDLPPDLDWPRMDGRALTYLAQIDLAEFRDERLPCEGLLVFFFERSGDFDGIDPSRVVHVPGPSVRRATPAGLETFAERRLVGVRGTSFPDFRRESPYLARVAATEDERRALIDWRSIVEDDLGRVGRQQLLGYPRGHQLDTLTAAARGFGSLDASMSFDRLQLLLQLRDESAADLDWWGGGNLAFVVPTEDLGAARFDRAWAVTELG